MTHEDEVAAAIRSRLLDREQIRRRLDDADLARLAPLARAEAANRLLGRHPAALAIADRAQRLLEHVRETVTALAILVEQVKRHPLGRLRANTRKALQRLDQLIQERRIDVGHCQNGSLSPAGNDSPPVTDESFSCTVCSI